jgi:hypothetical protein
MSVDSENEKILQEFMDVLDGEGEEEDARFTTQSIPTHFKKAKEQQNQSMTIHKNKNESTEN